MLSPPNSRPRKLRLWKVGSLKAEGREQQAVSVNAADVECRIQADEVELTSAELLRQAFISVDVTQTSLSRAARDHRLVTRYITSLANDVAIVDEYNTSAHMVCEILTCDSLPGL